jgi:hypothetical protein
MHTKTYRIDPSFNPEMQDLIQQVRPILGRVLGSAAERVEVSWEPGTPYNREPDPSARLKLTDSGVTRTREFQVWDLADEPRFRRLVYLMWDRLLAERLRLQKEAVLQSLSDATGE